MFKTTLFLIALTFTASSSLPIPDSRIKAPGTAPIDANTSMAATEVTVADWLQFIAANDFDSSLFPNENTLPTEWYKIIFKDLRKKGHFDHLIQLSNGVLWIRRDSLARSQVKQSHYPPINYPIVGINLTSSIFLV